MHLGSTLFLRKKDDHMNWDIESTLYVDPQTQPPADFCPICGGERYWPGLYCIRCEGGMV